MLSDGSTDFRSRRLFRRHQTRPCRSNPVQTGGGNVTFQTPACQTSAVLPQSPLATQTGTVSGCDCLHGHGDRRSCSGSVQQSGSHREPARTACNRQRRDPIGDIRFQRRGDRLFECAGNLGSGLRLHAGVRVDTWQFSFTVMLKNSQEASFRGDSDHGFLR